MANTYPSLSVKGMIYIHSGSPQICVSSLKTAQGRRGRSEDPIYTACGPKICMVRWCVMCLNPKCTTSMGHQLHYEPNTAPDSKPGSIRTMSVSQLQGGDRGGGGGGFPH